MEKAVFTLIVGFVLGIKHAFEPDHVVAVSTIVTQQKHPLKAALIGAFWGLGHTTTLFIIGIAVLVFRITIAEQLSLTLEFFVGVMLVFLGFQVLREQNIFHSHRHIHGKKNHQHFHIHKEKHVHRHKKSFLVGLVHGVAGSGALMLLVLSTISTFWEGMLYILLFGIGSIVGMSIMSLIIGFPIIYSTRKFPTIERCIKISSGVLSIVFGLVLCYEILFVEG